jgi:hypothetical protein
VRVTKKQRCPICQKDSWCLLHPEVVLCMRVANNRPKLLKSGETGYLHKLNQSISIPRPQPKTRVPTVDVRKLLTQWRANPVRQLQTLAGALGVSSEALGALGAVYASDHHGWAFPMFDGRGGLVGIRLRDDNGRKWAVTGSHQGLFYADSLGSDLCVICEGPTDTAAAMTLGYGSIGRPSCSGGVNDIAVLVQTRRIRRAVIVADNDTPGLNGAKMLADHLPIPSCLLILPCKDVRQFVNWGGDKRVMDALINTAVWTSR